MPYLKQRQQLILFFLLALFAVGCFGKALPSISIKAQWQSGITFDTPVSFNVTVFSHIATDNLVVLLSLPDGVSLLDGEKKKTISIQQSKPFKEVFTIQIPKNAKGIIRIEASIHHKGSTTFYAVAELPIKKFSFENKIADSAKKENFKRIKQKNGEWLRDYQLK